MSCPNCFAGHINPSTPTGHVTTLHGLDVYIAEPPENTEPKGIIVIIPDAFGWEFVNNRILADHYAQRGGFRVLLPDFMKGSFCLLPYFSWHPWEAGMAMGLGASYLG
jgi:hypothetical protein